MEEQLVINEVSAKIIELVAALGVTNIDNIPRAWQYRIDSQWQIAINGHEYPVTVEPEASMSIELPPFVIGVWYNGWLAGLFPPVGLTGVIAAGAGANQDTLIAAIDKALETLYAPAASFCTKAS